MGEGDKERSQINEIIRDSNENSKNRTGSSMGSTAVQTARNGRRSHFPSVKNRHVLGGLCDGDVASVSSVCIPFSSKWTGK